VKTHDVVIVGGGVIGLSLACNIRRENMSVIVLDRHQPGREASWAAGGMIAFSEIGPHAALKQLALASTKLYPSFIHTLQDESGIDVDYRRDGKIAFLDRDEDAAPVGGTLSPEDVRALEPVVEYSAPAIFVEEDWVDPRLVMEALVKSARHLGVKMASGAEVTEILVEHGKAIAAITTKARYGGGTIVNCAGAWAAMFSPVPVPTRPIKGQMLCLIPEQRGTIKHVIRGNGVYLIPRKDGRIAVGATIEDVGFDKRVDLDVIQKMHQAAAVLVPQLGQARIHEDWAGLRPGTPDKLPILGETPVEGYFFATGHYRDGIMLAPITAQVMTEIVCDRQPELDLRDFSVARFTA
jgi:glycine oxidase ThiO